MPSNSYPPKVEAIVSFDQKTVTDAKAQHAEDHTTQESIKKAAWCAFVAASIYALIAAYQGCLMRRATVATEKAAIAAKEQADLAWFSVEATQSASFKINEIVPTIGDFWRAYVANMGKGTAPRFELSYSIIHQSYPDGEIIDQRGPYSVNRAEVLPTDPTKGTDVVFDFQTPGYTQENRILTSAIETFKLQGVMSYDNGFKRSVSEPFCWETYPWTDTRAGWEDCNLAQSSLRKAHEAHQNKPN